MHILKKPILEIISDFDFNKLSGYKDYRLEENRLDGFLKSFKLRHSFNDFDSFFISKIAERKEYSLEECLWFSLIYGFSNSVIFSYVMVEKWGDFSSFDEITFFDWLDELTDNGETVFENIKLFLRKSNDNFSNNLDTYLMILVSHFRNNIGIFLSDCSYDDMVKESKSIFGSLGNDHSPLLFMYSYHILIDIDDDITVDMQYDYLLENSIDYLGYSSKVGIEDDSLWYDEILINIWEKCEEEVGKPVYLEDVKNHLILYFDIFNGVWDGYNTKFTKFTPNFMAVINCIQVLSLKDIFKFADWETVIRILKRRNSLGMVNYTPIYTKIPSLTGTIPGLHYVYKDEINIYDVLELHYPYKLKFEDLYLYLKEI